MPEIEPTPTEDEGDKNEQTKDDEPSFAVTLGRLAKSTAVIIFFLLVQWLTSFVLNSTGQAKESWAIFLLDKTTFFAVWGLIVVAGFEFLTICLETLGSFLVRLFALISKVRRER